MLVKLSKIVYKYAIPIQNNPIQGYNSSKLEDLLLAYINQALWTPSSNSWHIVVFNEKSLIVWIVQQELGRRRSSPYIKSMQTIFLFNNFYYLLTSIIFPNCIFKWWNVRTLFVLPEKTLFSKHRPGWHTVTWSILNISKSYTLFFI